MNEDPSPKPQSGKLPILLFNDECGVCRRIARWVQQSAKLKSGQMSILERPIGDDPAALRALRPDLDIWDAYARLHLLMPDGSVKLDAEAVAEVLRRLPNTRWFSWSFHVTVFGWRPFQQALAVAYNILVDVRPLFGCESCGTPSLWVRPMARVIKWTQSLFGQHPKHPSPHYTPRATNGRPTPSR